MKHLKDGKEQLKSMDFQKSSLSDYDWIKQTQDDPCDTMMPVRKQKETKDE